MFVIQKFSISVEATSTVFIFTDFQTVYYSCYRVGLMVNTGVPLRLEFMEIVEVDYNWNAVIDQM